MQGREANARSRDTLLTTANGQWFPMNALRQPFGTTSSNGHKIQPYSLTNWSVHLSLPPKWNPRTPKSASSRRPC